jgi:protein TonB
MGRYDDGSTLVVAREQAVKMSVEGEGGGSRRPQFPQDARLRAVGLCAVILLHFFLGILLVSALKAKLDIVSPPALLTKIIEPDRPKEQAPVLPALKILAPPAPFMPLPEIKTLQPPPPNAITIFSNVVAALPQPAAKEGGALAAGDRQLTAKGDAAGHVAPRMVSEDSCVPLYPPASRRLGQKGTTKLLLLIDLDGKVVSGKISQSSGYAWLDDAALAAITACAFVPGSFNGKPERVWHIVPYTFSLDR